MDLQAEIRQTRPFRSGEEETAVALLRTARIVADAGEVLFRRFGLSAAQYNILRILRGAGAEGLGRNAIRDRLLARMPDVTRLLDRMEAAKLIRRQRDDRDRRSVRTFLTGRGRARLAAVDPGLRDLQRHYFGHLSAAEQRTLHDLLGRIRGADAG